MFRVCINNLRCMIGQKKDGVQYGGDVILKSISKHYKQQTYSNKITISNIDINKLRDYRNGYKTVKNNLNKGKLNINLGGDHSIAVSTIQPLLEKYKENLLVVWIDAHADLNTYESSETKSRHGMPLGALMGLTEHWFKINGKKIVLHPENLIYIGIRDLDKFENDIIKDKCIANYPHFTNELFEKIKKHPSKHIHISCDIDSMSPSIMPSTGTAVNNGLNVKHVTKIIDACKSRLVGFDLVEFNPLIGNKREVRKTLQNIITILKKVLP